MRNFKEGWPKSSVGLSLRVMISQNSPKKLAGAAVCALAVYAVGACSAGPELRLETSPILAGEKRQFTLVDDGSSDAAALRAMSAALQSRGGVLAADGQRLDVTLAVRPATIGAYSDDIARDGIWVETPRKAGARRGHNVHVMTAVLSGPDTPRRVATVSARHDKAVTPPALLERMSQAAAVSLLEGSDSAAQD